MPAFFNITNFDALFPEGATLTAIDRDGSTVLWEGTRSDLLRQLLQPSLTGNVASSTPVSSEEIVTGISLSPSPNASSHNSEEEEERSSNTNGNTNGVPKLYTMHVTKDQLLNLIYDYVSTLKWSYLRKEHCDFHWPMKVLQTCPEILLEPISFPPYSGRCLLFDCFLRYGPKVEYMRKVICLFIESGLKETCREDFNPFFSFYLKNLLVGPARREGRSTVVVYSDEQLMARADRKLKNAGLILELLVEHFPECLNKARRFIGWQGKTWLPHEFIANHINAEDLARKVFVHGTMGEHWPMHFINILLRGRNDLLLKENILRNLDDSIVRTVPPFVKEYHQYVRAKRFCMKNQLNAVFDQIWKYVYQPFTVA